jgi:hypothetical protein
MKNHTRPRSGIITVTAFATAIFAAGCGLTLGNPDIYDLHANPGRYHDRTVNIEGVVTTSWGIPVVPFRFYRVDDGTGVVTVLSNTSRTPSRGARVRVKGRVNDFAVIGGRPLGLHLREERLQVRRGRWN